MNMLVIRPLPQALLTLLLSALVTAAQAQITLRQPIDIRTGAEESYPVKARLNAGDSVDVEWTTQGFAHVVYNAVAEAYVPSRYLRAGSAAECAAAGLEVPTCGLATTTVNIRTGKSTATERIGQLNAGDAVAVDGFEGDYVRLQVPVRATGYVRSDILAVAAAGPTVSAVRATPPPAVAASAPLTPPPAAQRPEPTPPPAAASAPQPVASAPPPGAAATPAPVRASAAPRPPVRPAVHTPTLRWTAGLGLGHSFSLEKESDIVREFAERGLTASFDRFRRDDTAYEAFAQVQLLPFLGLRVGYLAMTDVDSEIRLSDDDLDAARAAVGDFYPVGGPGGTATVQWDLRGNGWALTLGAGAFFPTDRDVRIVSGDNVIIAKGPDATALYRIGFEKRIMSNWDVGLDLNITDRNGVILTPIALKIQKRWYH